MEAVASGGRKDLWSRARTQSAWAEGIVALGIGRPAVKNYWVLSRHRPLCRIGPGDFCRSTWLKLWRAGSMRGGCLFSLQQVGLVAGLLPRCPPFPSRADVLGPRRASRKLVCRGGGTTSGRHLPSARESILKSEDLTTTGRATRLRAAARRREHGSQQEKRPTRIVQLSGCSSFPKLRSLCHARSSVTRSSLGQRRRRR